MREKDKEKDKEKDRKVGNNLDKLLDLFSTIASLDTTDKRPIQLPHVTSKEMFKTFESLHPYENNTDVTFEISFPGAEEIKITFDTQSATEKVR